jgi:hypothetical protein
VLFVVFAALAFAGTVTGAAALVEVFAGVTDVAAFCARGAVADGLAVVLPARAVEVVAFVSARAAVDFTVFREAAFAGLAALVALAVLAALVTFALVAFALVAFAAGLAAAAALAPLGVAFPAVAAGLAGEAVLADLADLAAFTAFAGVVALAALAAPGVAFLAVVAFAGAPEDAFVRLTGVAIGPFRVSVPGPKGAGL